MPWKPEGYPEVSPYLVVEDAEATLSFLEELFGATPLRRYDTPDGSVMHAELRIGQSVVMIGEAGGEWKPVPAFLSDSLIVGVVEDPATDVQSVLVFEAME